jgi:UDP-N-acetylmuramoylalanine--D-glutamate ligase
MKNKVINFEYIGYRLSNQNKTVNFSYGFNFSDREPLTFNEEISFSKPVFHEGVPKEVVLKALEGTHIMLGVSYYKLFCPSSVVLPYQLTTDEAEFWTKLYRQGMGEFYFQNKLDPLSSPEFVATTDYKSAACRLVTTSRALIGIGGGKDSIVAAEILREAGIEIAGFVVPQTEKTAKIIQDSINALGIGSVEVQRIVDPKIRDKYENSYNGHVPISGVFAFLGLLTALIEDYKYIVVGNEQSSNVGNTEINGITINHQWSKSSEFETLFQYYIKNSLTKDITYFSILRPFDEIRIVELFTKYPKYFKHFTSCNRNFRQESTQSSLWCGECPKCLFIFLLFSAFLKKEQLVSIFGRNLFDKEGLLPLFRDILGIGGMKPFDCVGTFDEAQVAFCMAKEEYRDSYVVKHLQGEITDNELLKKRVFATAKATLIPDYLRFAGLNTALILGFDVEGRASKDYLKSYFPGLEVGIADQKDGDSYLEKQFEYDISVKTPGIAASKMNSYYTTATNIFFSKVKGTTIGVTGTKGKSTVSALLYEIMKAAGKDVSLVGNIGSPMLDSLDDDSSDKIYIVELSSYQLDDVRYSPDIALVLNLMQDHMTYHGDIEAYHEAKMNIVKYQNSSDCAFYNSDDKVLSDFMTLVSSVIVPFTHDNFDTKLLGAHNQFNINAASTVARHLGVEDKLINMVVSEFTSLEHRLELVGEKNGVKFYDDAISTTPESTIAAIKCFDKIDSIILGGTDRGYDYSELERVVYDRGIRNIVLFPDTGNRIISNRAGLNILETTNTNEAVRFCSENSVDGVCLMSPASPSFSCFKNYKDRGDQFKDAVAKL